MAKIVEPPKPMRGTCRACRAVVEYLPEEIQKTVHRSYDDSTDTYFWVKCPREKCPGKVEVPDSKVPQDLW